MAKPRWASGAGARAAATSLPLIQGAERSWTNSNHLQPSPQDSYSIGYPFPSDRAGGGWQHFPSLLLHFPTLLILPLIDTLITSNSNNKEHRNSTFRTIQGSQFNPGALLRRNTAGNDGGWQAARCLAEVAKSIWKLKSTEEVVSFIILGPAPRQVQELTLSQGRDFIKALALVQKW